MNTAVPAATTMDTSIITSTPAPAVITTNRNITINMAAPAATITNIIMSTIMSMPTKPMTAMQSASTYWKTLAVPTALQRWRKRFAPCPA